MMREYIKTIRENKIATLILNRPEQHNAFDDNLIQELTTELKNVDSDPALRIVILTAIGKSFCAGADLNWMQRVVSYSRADNMRDAQELATLMQTLNNLSKPTICLIQGAAYGGGVGLVACCDIAIATSEASFCLSEVKLGLIPAVISPYVLAAMGARIARRYFLTAEKFSALEALRFGLVHEVVPTESLAQTGQALAQTLLQNSPQAITAAKQLIQKVNYQVLSAKLIEETVASIADIRVSAEGQEGLQAFLEKRVPNW